MIYLSLGRGADLDPGVEWSKLDLYFETRLSPDPHKKKSDPVWSSIFKIPLESNLSSNISLTKL